MNSTLKRCIAYCEQAKIRKSAGNMKNWETSAAQSALGFEWSDTVTWCMVEWCTQNMHRDSSISRGTSHATTKEHYQYTTSEHINNTRYKRIQSLIQNHMRHVRIESAREQRIALYKSYE